MPADNRLELVVEVDVNKANASIRSIATGLVRHGAGGGEGCARLLDLPFGQREVTINIGSAATLYKKLITSTEGYAGDVPIIHQAVAVKAAIDVMDTAFAGGRDASS